MKILSLLLALCVFILNANAQERDTVLSNRNGEYLIRVHGTSNNAFMVTVDRATKIAPSIHAKVEQDVNSTLKYIYTVTNGRIDTQAIQTIEIDRQADVVDETNLQVVSKDIQEGEFVNGEWVSTVAHRWELGNGQPPIAPGSSLGEFILRSTGLPGIVRAKFQGAIQGVEYPAGVSRGEIDSIVETIKNYPANRVRRLTIGTVKPPQGEKELVATLSSYVSRCLPLDWITDTVLSGNYSRILNSIQSKLDQHDPASAVELLKTFLQDVNHDSASGLSTEAYALLYFNADYLKTKLESESSLPTYTITVTKQGEGIVVQVASERPSINIQQPEVSSSDEGSNASFSAHEGETLYFAIVPAQGYDVQSIFADGELYVRPVNILGLSQYRWPIYTFQNIAQNHTLKAVFKKE